MIDFAAARRTMVDCQIRANDVTDMRLLEAFLAVPRERFVPSDKQSLAYIDMDLPVGGEGRGRYLIKPMVLAKLLQAAKIASGDTVLDVGSATGYAAAVLSRVAAHVVALEGDQKIGALAATELAGLPNVTAVIGPPQAGHAAGAPYDVIVVEGAVEEVPPALCGQLKEGGRLVAVVGTGRSGRATVFVRGRREVSGRDVFDAALPPLPGFEKPAAFVF